MHKVCKRKAVRDPAPADSGEGRCAGSRRPRPPGAKAQLRSQDRRGWEGRVSQALPSIQSCPHSNPGPKDGEGWRFPCRALNPEGDVLSFSTRVPFPLQRDVSRIPETRSPGREESGSVFQGRPLALQLQAGTDIGSPAP